MLMLQCVVTKSSQTTLNKLVYPWEAMILEAIYGGGLEVLEEVEGPDCQSDPAQEYARLATLYKDPENPDSSWVERLFGANRPGVVALEREMEKAAAWGIKPAREPRGGKTEAA